MTTPNAPRKTLGLTGITINAMALIAPGAFVWLLYQMQVAGAVNGLGGIWPGVLVALCTALLTAFSFGELARRYPEAGLRSAYHFAEQVFKEQNDPKKRRLARIAKFATGWSAHLYYWVYPGVMVAFMSVLADYLLRQFDYHPTVFGQIILAAAFSALIGFLALRGITGSTPSSVILNTIQVTSLVIFSIVAIVFRFANPAGILATEWLHPSVSEVLLPPDFSGLVFQVALAMILMVGFESSTSLGALAANPHRDIPRATILALLIQGALVYLLAYFAAGLAFNTRLDMVGSTAPIGELALQIGDLVLRGNGFTLMLVMAFTVMIALLGATLTAVNNGVRISFSMALDSEMPDLLGALHPRFATPYNTVIFLTIFATIIGIIGIVGGLPALMGIILAASTGAFLLYAILCILTITTFARTGSFNWFRHGLLPLAGAVISLGVVIGTFIVGLNTGGIIAQACLLALGLAVLWLLVSGIYYILRR